VATEGSNQEDGSPPSEDFEPVIRAGLPLSPTVIASRVLSQAEHDRLDGLLRPRVESHLLAYQSTVDGLAEGHRQIAETMDFGMGARTRWTAVWEMSGRCLALSNCMLAQLRVGYGTEAVPTMRAMHEAGLVLTVLAGPGEENLLRQWLDDRRYIKADTARRAEARIEKPYMAAVKEAGLSTSQDLGAAIYAGLSKAGHNMRGSLLESFAEPLRQFAYAPPHPNPRLVAVHVDYGGELIEEVALRVGAALGQRFLGKDWFDGTIKPLIGRMEAVRRDLPIDPDTVNAL
jgi:hypothetical protein